MDYVNKQSIEATVNSYYQALDKLTNLCPNLEMEANCYNQRIALPTSFRPKFGFDNKVLWSNVNNIRVQFEPLMDFGQPKIISQSYTIWRERWLYIYAYIDVPFTYYAWECATVTYPDGFDETGEPKGMPKTTPAKMVEWCSPQCITLEVSGCWGKAFAIKDWNAKHQEIVDLGDVFLDKKIKDIYLEGVAKADKALAEWQTAIRTIQTMIPAGGCGTSFGGG